MSQPLVDIRNITHRFGEHAALKDVSLKIAPGSYTVLLGPSGSGKTTLLSILGGFVTPSEGQVLIGGADCTMTPPAKRPTTTVFQDYALFPHMSVGRNVAFGLRMRGVARKKRKALSHDALALVGLADAFHKRPHQLSGGQRQRVALARALVVEPAVLLLDEPLGALDLKLRRQMQDELKAIQKRVGTAFVHVTHDQEEAMALADHCVVMNDGRIEDEGSPERVYTRPATRFAAGFMGESTLLEGDVVEADGGTTLVETTLGRLRLPASAPVHARVTLAIRPEHLAFDEPGEDEVQEESPPPPPQHSSSAEAVIEVLAAMQAEIDTSAQRREERQNQRPPRSGPSLPRASGGEAPGQSPAGAEASAHALSLGQAMVSEVVFQGSFKRALAVSLTDPTIRFIARLAANVALQPGDTVSVSCRSGDVILLTR